MYRAADNQTLKLMREMMSQCSHLCASLLPLLERKTFIYEFSFVLECSFVSPSCLSTVNMAKGSTFDVLLRLQYLKLCMNCCVLAAG